MFTIKSILTVSFILFLSGNSVINIFEPNYFDSTYESIDWYEGELHLKDGKIKKGLIKYISTGAAIGGLQSFNKIYFKEDKEAKKIKYKKELINYFIISKETDKITKYTYISIKKKKSVLARVVIEGKASLYIRVMNPNSQSNFSNTPLRPLDYFCYVLKEGDDLASGMFMPNVLKSFKKEASQYFINCESVSNKIKNGELGLEDKEQIVNDYNNCI